MNAAGTPSFELQALLDAAVDAVILIDHRGQVEVFNRAAERLFGYSAPEILGKNVNILMTETESAMHDAYLERYGRTRVPHIIGIGREVRCRRNDGSTFCALLSVGRIAETTPPRYVGFLQDQTLRKQALASAVRERDRANGYLEAVQTILLALNLEGQITLINRKGCEVLGLEETDLLGKDWFDCALALEERASSRAEFKQFLASNAAQPYYGESYIRARDGRRRLIAWRYVAMADPGGDVTGILCSGDDVTDARQAQAEARESRERMMHVSRLATMGEMAAGVSHELNQPLAAITTYAQAARRLLDAAGDAEADVTDALEQIAAQALRAGEIIKRLRHLVRNRETQRDPTQINAMIRELGTLTRADARMHNVRVRLALVEGLPELEVDSIQLQQVILNLVRNAVQSLQHEESAEREVVISTALADDGYIEIKMCDTGSGVTVDMLDRLFFPFATTKSDGAGLGLAISRGIIEAHKGTLTYEPNAPRGACFKIRLPIPKETGA